MDLLLVHGDDEPRARAASEGIFTPLWDLKLEVGAAVRTPEECERLAAEDHTARTALLDCRFLAGDRALYGELERRVLRGLTQAQVDELVAAKAEELVRRRERFGGSVHLLEPNVKQSPGGLRDLQAALWISRARFKAAGLSDLLNRGVLPPREVERLKAARDLLWKVRNQLHYLAGRREDHLTFDRQEQVAAALGYERGTPEPGSAAPPHGLGVERFMRDYYLAADAIRRLADEIIDRCQASGQTPGHAPRGRTVAPGLKLWQGRLTLEGREALAADPSLFVRLFTTAEELGVPIYPWARDLCREEAARLDDAARVDPRVTGALRTAFARCTRAEWVRQMHREGVLGALLPEFGRVTALHQHDMYHVYTVDTHLVFALQRLGALMGGELLDQEPLASHVAREVTRPLALALGVLFHDAGKGLGGDHSRKGAELVRKVCERLGVPEPEAADAEFLVAEHLVMSHTSQRRDLSDPELIAGFAARMGDRRRLDMLFLLTYVDIASVGPQTWNEWKRRLLTELYEKSAAELERPAAPRPDTAHRQALEGRGYSTERIEAFLQLLPRRYFSFADPGESPRALRVLEQGARRELTAVARELPASDMTLLTVSTEDRPGLLSVIAGVLTAHRIDILGADVFSTADGRALDFFVVRGPRGGGVERARFRRGEAGPGAGDPREPRPSPGCSRGCSGRRPLPACGRAPPVADPGQGGQRRCPRLHRGGRLRQGSSGPAPRGDRGPARAGTDDQRGPDHHRGAQGDRRLLRHRRERREAHRPCEARGARGPARGPGRGAAAALSGSRSRAVPVRSLP